MQTDGRRHRTAAMLPVQKEWAASMEDGKETS